MIRALRTTAADRDLRKIAYQIGIESKRPATADQIVDELIDCCDYLSNSASTLKAGTLSPELGHDVRLYSFRRWVILFRYLDDGILVLRIVDGSQDYLTWKLEADR